MDNKIQYLNTDLDLTSSEDLTSLASALESRGVFPLHVTHGEDGLWYSTFETVESFTEPDGNIAALLDVIESLVPDLRAVWSRCRRREFNIGFDCGDEPWAFNQALPSELLGRMAAVGASLRWTLYPDRSHVAEQSTPTMV
jgi:hypothetical protein